MLKLITREQPRKVGGVGTLRYPLLSDITKSISQNYSAPALLPHDALVQYACTIMHVRPMSSLASQAEQSVAQKARHRLTVMFGRRRAY